MAKNTARGAVVITGASTGIGKATALRLDRHGHHVFAGVRKESDGDALKQEASGSLTPLLIDVTDEKSIAGAVDMVADAVGERGLAGLVNNAGITVSSPVEFVPLDEVRRQF